MNYPHFQLMIHIFKQRKIFSGDSRSNQNPQLAITQILFVREHNRIAKELALLNPHWNDERLFQEARRILIAAYQAISYYEWLPIFLGIYYLYGSHFKL